jgi:cytochrome c553
MKKLLKWTGIILLVLVVGVAVFVFSMINKAENRLSHTYAITPEKLTIPADSASIANGRHICQATCTACHENDFGGRKFFEDEKLATLYTPNLTSGKGGIGATYTDADWVRALRHGVDPKGRPLFIMPARELHNLSAGDLGSVIAYLHTLPPVDRERGVDVFKPFGKFLIAMGAFGDVINAETIDHTAPLPPEPERGPTSAHGKYLVDVHGCRTCHGAELNGGKDPNPHAPMAPNLTPGGEPGKWDAAGFVKTLRTGITPTGRVLNKEFMAWPYYGQLSDEELQAVFAYLLSLKAMPTAEI